MLMLIFYVGSDCFCCSCDSILEIIPRIPLKKILQGHSYLVGLMNYGGEAIPVVDYSMLLANRFSKKSMHTRIILLTNPANGPMKTLGLIAEKVIETRTIDPLCFNEIGMHEKKFPFLDGIYNAQKESIQRIHIDQLFTFLQNA